VLTGAGTAGLLATVPVLRSMQRAAASRTPTGDGTPSRSTRDPSIDWIVAQIHEIACSSSKTGNGSDRGIRENRLPLFGKYQVDLVLNGHDHDYERSFPVRGVDHMAGQDAVTGAPLETLRRTPTSMASQSFQKVGHVQLVVLFEYDRTPPRGGRIEHAGRGSGVGPRTRCGRRCH